MTERERAQATRRSDELRRLRETETRRLAGEDATFGHRMLARLAEAGRYRDEETAEHVQRMSESCGLIARGLGLPADGCEALSAAAALHDIGKVGVPDAVLRKPGKLTAAERELVESHTEIGYQILSGSGDPLVELAATIALNHHERPDGTGYPRGLTGEEIPIEARIAAVADVFDALTHDRVYRKRYGLKHAMDIMREGRGTQFDAGVFDAFLDVLTEVVELGEQLRDTTRPSAYAVQPPGGGERPTRVVVVDDHAAVGRGLELLLRREGMEVLGNAPTAAAARSLLATRDADVAIIDADLAGESGLELIGDAHTAGARVLLYTGRADHPTLAACAASEALGVVTKTASTVELMAAVRAVAAGERYRDPRLPADRERAPAKRHRLTAREREIVTLLAQGLNGEEIAEILFLSAQTIRTHVRKAMARIGARSRAQLIALAVAGDEIVLEAPAA